MKSRSVLTLVLIFFVLLPISLLPLDSGFAQNLEGRWVLGFHGGGNVWINDYNKVQIGPGGDVMLRYGISQAFSAGFLAGYEEMKSKQEPPVSGRPSYLKLHAIPASAAVWVHFSQGKYFNPYVYAGIGAMIYKTLDANNVYIPDSKFRSSIHLPFGIGFEVFASKSASIVVDFGYRVTDDHPDALKSGKIDGYATAKVGVNVYLGTSDADAEAQRLKDAEARRVKELAEAEARRLKQQADADAEARRVKELADAEARRLKELADAEARRLAEQKGRDTTIIILEKGKTVVLKGVNFEFNKATLTKESETILMMAYNALVANPNVNVEISGHTDNVGSQEYNQKLSLERAQAVKNWLVKKGIASNRMKTVGKGPNEPVASNNTNAGRAENRRIEFYVQD